MHPVIHRKLRSVISRIFPTLSEGDLDEKSKFTDSQIITILKENETGILLPNY